MFEAGKDVDQKAYRCEMTWSGYGALIESDSSRVNRDEENDDSADGRIGPSYAYDGRSLSMRVMWGRTSYCMWIDNQAQEGRR